MAIKNSGKKEQKPQLEPIVKDQPSLLHAPVVSSKKKKRSLSIPGFSQLPSLAKLRIVITLLFVLYTSAILLLFMNGYVISAVLIVISYLMVFLLMVKLFLIRKL